jgi:capsular polysaccharide biosynthesis protein
VRTVAVVAGCVLAGLAAGAIWTLLQSDRYRADARVLVRPASARIVPAVEALAESSLVETNVAQTLHLSSLPKISAEKGESGVLTVSVAAGNRERARQIDAEAVVILMQKVAQRFGTVGATATVLDPAHVAEQTSPTAGRNLLICGLAGLVAGIAVAVSLSRRRRHAAARTDAQVEQRLRARIDQVATRERALAQRAGQLAAREQDLGRREGALAAAASRLSPAEDAVTRREEELERREHELARRADELSVREAELEAAAAEPEPEPEPEPVPPASVLPAARGAWTLRDLESLTSDRSQAGASSSQQQEWSTYLFLLREHANADGTLPASFDPLVNDVFGPLPQPTE